jgi:hypothetical protein
MSNNNIRPATASEGDPLSYRLNTDPNINSLMSVNHSRQGLPPQWLPVPRLCQRCGASTVSYRTRGQWVCAECNIEVLAKPVK